MLERSLVPGAPSCAAPACARRARALVLLVIATSLATGLAACRSLPTEGDQSAQNQASPVTLAEASEPAEAAAAAEPSTPPAAIDEGEVQVMGTTASSQDEAANASADASQAPDADAAPASTPAPVREDWELIGQPYIVDDESPRVAGDGTTTTFTLWFRTRGDFRGVRQGTSLSDDRHYKVGLITVPELPAFVPGGTGMIELSPAMKQKGRFCWTATLHQQGQRGQTRFPLRRNGAALQVQLDLRGAPVQRRTATVIVRNAVSERPPKTPEERALACR